VDAATDVLSFPMIDYDLHAATKRDMAADTDPETGELLLGDIVVSVERAQEQAREYGHSFEREFGYLVVHGMLHLLRYDHIEDADARVMRAMEERILGDVSLTRDV
jgi:probable rRNA maturation factor